MNLPSWILDLSSTLDFSVLNPPSSRQALGFRADNLKQATARPTKRNGDTLEAPKSTLSQS